MFKKLFVARNEDGSLFLFNCKPTRHEVHNYWFVEDKEYNSMEINNCWFIELSWENEPMEVSLIEMFRLSSLMGAK